MRDRGGSERVSEATATGDTGGNSPITCSICLEEPLRCPVETNCGHKFCARCILNLWRHERHPRPCRCPLCRREVTLLLGGQEFSESDPTLFQEVLDFNEQMAGTQGGLWSRLRDLPVLLQHLRRDAVAPLGRGLPVCSKLYLLALALAVFIYFISPVDFIPEGIFGIFGLADDVLICVSVLLYSAAYYRTWIINMGRELAIHTQ